MPTIADIRAQYPQYQDMQDNQLADALYGKFYSDMPREQFNTKIGLTPQAPPVSSVEGASAIATNPAQPPLGSDLLGGTLSGTERGALSSLGMIGDARSLASSAANKIGSIAGASPDTISNVQKVAAGALPGPLGMAFNNAPTTDQLTKGYENLTGPIYNPQGIPGKTAQNITEFLPAMIGGPESLGSKLLTRAIIPGAASEAAGELTQGTAAEPYAKVAAALTGAVGASKVANRLMGPALESLPNAAQLKSAATSVYKNPQIRATSVAESDLNLAADKAASDLKNSYFHPEDEKPVFDILKEIKTAGPSATVNELDNWSGRLGKLAKQTQMGNEGPEPTSTAAAAMKAKNHIDDLLSKVAPGWDTADANYSAFKSATGLDKRTIKAQIRAEGGTGDYAARLKSTATQMLTNPRATRGLSADEMELLRTISKGTATQRTVGWFGDLLGNRLKHGIGTLIGGGIGLTAGPVGGAVGATLGAVADTGISRGLMGIRNSLANRQAQALSSAILSRSPLGAPIAARNAQVLGLNAPASINQMMLRSLLARSPSPDYQSQ